MQQYVVVFFPKFNLKKIQEFRKKHDPQYNVIAPHVTLMFPFSNVSESQIAQHLNSIIKNIKPFKIHLQNLIKSFDNYLFLLVNEGKEEINEVHGKLYLGIMAPYSRNDIPFIPHITLGEFNKSDNQLDRKRYDNVYAEAKSLNLNIWCNFDSISLIRGDGKTPAKTIRSFTLVE